MAEVFDKVLMDEVAGQELAKQAKAYADKKAGEINTALEGYQPKGDYAESSDLEGLATETYVDGKVAGLVNSAPETLDTLKELADALGNDANFSATVTANIGKKLDTATYEEDKATFETKENAAATYQPKGDYVEEDELENYQPKGDYALKSEIPNDYLTDDDIADFLKGYEVKILAPEKVREWFS